MKYAWAGLAAVAAVAALFFRPPGMGTAAIPAAHGRPTDSSVAIPAESPSQRIFPAPRSTRARQIIVYVAGEVRAPGVYALPSGSRGVDALRRAGGALAEADLLAVNLAAPLNDGDELAVTKIGEPAARNRIRSAHPRQPPPARRPHVQGRQGRQGRRAAAPTPPAQSIDINAADEIELEGVPGIGPGLAARIVAYRASNGPFTSLDELADVAGITPRLQAALAEFAVVR